MFGKRLRKLIKDRHLTLKEFGAKFSLAESTISGYVNETRKPDIDLIKQFADYFDVTIDFLMGLDERAAEPRTEYQVKDKPLSDIDKKIIEEFNKLSKEDQDYVIGLIERIKKQ